MIVIHAPLQRQPRWPSLLDRQNELGAKVITHIPLTSETPRSAVQNQLVTLASGGTYVGTLKGRGLLGSGAAGAASVPLFLSLYGQITVSLWFYWPVYGVADKLLMEYTANFNSAAGGFIFDPDDATSFVIGTSTGASSATNTVRISNPTAAVWHRLTACFDITNAQTVRAVYVDGVSVTLTPATSVTGGATVFANDTLHLLSRNEASLFGGGTVQDLTIYKGVLSATEAASDYANPYQILRPLTRLLFDNVPERLMGQAGQMFAMGLGA